MLDQRGQEASGNRRAQAERERPIGPIVHQAQRSRPFTLLENDALCPLEVFHREWRGVQSTISPVKERHPQFVLQRLDTSGERRLTQVHRIGRSAERSGVHQGEKVLQLSSVHGFLTCS
ncbi:hypothetical protein D3C86_1753010 [compost metagenome]